LAQRGQRLLLLDRDEDSLRQLADDLRAGTFLVQPPHVLPLDLAEHNATRWLARYCREHRLRIATLINCAGVGAHVALSKHNRRSIREIIDVNVRAVVELTRLVLPTMLRRRSGTIINVSSTGAFQRMPHWAVYGGSKAFVQNFTESLQQELAGSGVYVAAVCPGVTRTPFFRSSGMDESLVMDYAQEPEDVVAEALRGIDKQQALIVTGLTNRMRIHAQRLSLRAVCRAVLAGARKVRCIWRHRISDSDHQS
jgi:short-subunit dehydrogenase